MGDPRLVVVDGADALDREGADLVSAAVAGNPSAAVVVATGQTPMGLYAELAVRHRAGRLDTSGLTVLQLDEYLGLSPEDHRSLYGWMRRSFLDPLAIDEARVVRLPVDGDLGAACAAHDRMLRERRWPDIAILGLGTNGHLGFNEPPSDASSPTRVVELSTVTIEANARYWGARADVPPRAVTLGMEALLRAPSIVLVVSGRRKGDIVRRALEGPIGPDVPATFLREARGDVTVIVDREAWGNG